MIVSSMRREQACSIMKLNPGSSLTSLLALIMSANLFMMHMKGKRHIFINLASDENIVGLLRITSSSMERSATTMAELRTC